MLPDGAAKDHQRAGVWRVGLLEQFVEGNFRAIDALGHSRLLITTWRGGSFTAH
jgi:hypothetical protein